jgi:streptogramin lyase
VLPIEEIDTLADLIAQCVNSGGGTAGDGTACGNLFSLAPDSTGTVYPTNSLAAALNIAHNPGRNVAALYSILLTGPVFTPTLSSAPNDWTIAITYSGGGLSAPTAIATDSAGSVWITNSGNSSVTKLDYTGTPLSGSSGFTAGSLSTPSAIAIDANGNAWVANAGNNTISMLNPSGTAGNVYSGNGLSNPASIAIDGSGNVWVANSGSNALSAFTSSGTKLSGSPFTGAGLSTPVSIAVTPK